MLPLDQVTVGGTDKKSLDSPLRRLNMANMSRRSRIHWARIIALFVFSFLFLLWKGNRHYRPRFSISSGSGAERIILKAAPPRGFKPFDVNGFVNTGKPGKIQCDSLRHTGELYAEKSRHVEDDIQAIAESLKDHPTVDYSSQDKSLSHKDVVEKTWLRMAQSSVWLERYDVYMTVTRVVFYTKGVRHWPVISFLRAQIHDRNWKELRDYDIHWQGETIRFPRILDIPAPYVVGGGFYGPEDPRIIIEDHPEAEPVIIFNMIADVEKLYRAMWIMRPFSNDTTMLNIAGQGRGQSEKNWMPFMYKETTTGMTTTGASSTHDNEWPTHYIHFIYQFKPLRVLKCHLLNGWCEWVYQQEVPDSLRGHHNDTGGRFRGGTNMVPLSNNKGVQSFIGFPKSNVHLGCEAAFYRPSILVFTAASPNHFHIDYMSDSFDFGDAALTPEAKGDPCGEGRIMMANSIAKWDRSAGEDLMWLTLTVDDVTTQILRVHGIEAFIDTIPDRSRRGHHMYETLSQVGPNLYDLQWSGVGHDILACGVEATMNYTIAESQGVNGTDLRKIRLEKEKKLKEEEEKVKELTKIKLEEARIEDERKAKEALAEREKKLAEDEKLRKEKELDQKVADAVKKAKEEERLRRLRYKEEGREADFDREIIELAKQDNARHEAENKKKEEENKKKEEENKKKEEENKQKEAETLKLAEEIRKKAEEAAKKAEEAAKKIGSDPSKKDGAAKDDKAKDAKPKDEKKDAPDAPKDDKSKAEPAKKDDKPAADDKAKSDAKDSKDAKPKDDKPMPNKDEKSIDDAHKAEIERQMKEDAKDDLDLLDDEDFFDDEPLADDAPPPPNPPPAKGKDPKKNKGKPYGKEKDAPGY